MKINTFKPVPFIIAFSLFTLFCSAQKLSVTDQKAKTEEDFETDSWTAHLDQDVKDAQKSFTDFIETTFKYKVDKRSKSIYVVERSKFIEITPMRIDVRAVFQSESAGSAVSFVFTPGYDIYFSNLTYKEEYLKAQFFVNSFVRFHYSAYYNKVIDEIGSKIKGKESDIKSTESKIDKLKSSIAENNAKISGGDPNGQKLQDKNAKSQKEIDDKNLEIERLRKDILNYQDDIIKATVSLKTVAEFK